MASPEKLQRVRELWAQGIRAGRVYLHPRQFSESALAGFAAVYGLRQVPRSLATIDDPRFDDAAAERVISALERKLRV